MAARALRTPTTTAVLGLLAESPRHVYDMRVTMRERGHDRVLEIKSASLYDALRRLAAAGMVETAETIRDSARPERTVYRITHTGTQQLLQWLRELLSDPARGRIAFTGALMCMYALPQEEVADLLDGRADRLDEEIAATDATTRTARSQGLPLVFLSEDSYTQALRRAERDWSRAFADDLRTRRLTWPERTFP
ncbi:PadR family transcriptional regulator [Kitasatospora sp. NPDC101155]|uniref:PadR family transcriptional regulator n=1 Tax=Kitasatospora sp. NPDC101155 TaxID=3364097 RepID=UPI0038106EFA